MALIRTDSDLNYASLVAQDLCRMIRTYLKTWKQYANGRNGACVPDESFDIVITPISALNTISFRLIYTETTRTRVPEYYDPDSDYFNESWGASNISGYRVDIEYNQRERNYTIPSQALLLSREKLEKSIQEFVIKDDERIKEKQRLAEITQLKTRLNELTNGSNDEA